MQDTPDRDEQTNRIDFDIEVEELEDRINPIPPDSVRSTFPVYPDIAITRNNLTVL